MQETLPTSAIAPPAPCCGLPVGRSPVRVLHPLRRMYTTKPCVATKTCDDAAICCAENLRMPETIGARIARIAKERKGWAPAEFAAALGVSYESVRKWITGETAPNRNRLAKVGALLGVAPEELLLGVVATPALVRGTSLATSKMVELIARLAALPVRTRRTALSILHGLVEAPEEAQEIASELARLLGEPSLERPVKPAGRQIPIEAMQVAERYAELDRLPEAEAEQRRALVLHALESLLEPKASELSTDPLLTEPSATPAPSPRKRAARSRATPSAARSAKR